MTKTTLIKSAFITIALSTSAVALADGEATYKEACAVCHGAGIAGAPKLGDKEAWAPRIATGTDALYETSLKGKGAMPAKGGRADKSDDDIKAAVDYMVEQSK
jgi:cytochrome c5